MSFYTKTSNGKQRAEKANYQIYYTSEQQNLQTFSSISFYFYKYIYVIKAFMANNKISE